MNANLARHMSDRPGGVHHQPGGFFLKLQGIVLPLFRHLIPSFPVKILLDPLSGKFKAPHLEEHPRLKLLYGARYSPHDNPVEPIWAGLKNYVANTAATWPGRLRQIHSFFRNRSPSQMLDAAAPWTSPWLPPGYEQNFWNAA
jgi:hypothetical protein